MNQQAGQIIDLWAPGIQARVLSGELKIPCGAQVFAGNRELPSVFFGVSSGGTIIAFHGPDAREKFERYAAAHRKNQQRLGGELVFVKIYGNRYAGRVVKKGRTRMLVRFKLQDGRYRERFFPMKGGAR